MTNHWTPEEIEAGETLAELKEQAWTLVDILELVNGPYRDWDMRLRDFEDSYCEASVWIEAVAELRRLTEGR